MFMVNNTDIIICVHNGLSLVKECLEAAAANSGNCRLIIVDDNSHKATKDYLISFSLRHQCTLIENLDTLGYEKSAQKGIAASFSQSIILLDSQTVVRAGWLKDLFAYADFDHTIFFGFERSCFKVKEEMFKEIDLFKGKINSAVMGLLDKSILFLLPTLGGSGGAHTVVQEIIALREYGLNVKAATFKSYSESFLFHHPKANDFLFTFGQENDEELQRISGGFGIVIATNYKSVRYLKKIVDNRPEVIPMYYIQDHEPWFFPQGDLRRVEAEQSYTLIPDIACFAYSGWLCKIVKELYGIEAAKIEPCLDRTIFNRYSEANINIRGPVRITAMVRPATSVRSPKETLRILKIIKRKYKDKVDIRTFGCSDEELDRLDESRGFRFINLGGLKRPQVAEVLKGSDIFIDASEYQAFGFTGLEAMASGSAAVLPKDCGTGEYAKDRKNSLLVDTRDINQVVSAVETLICDRGLLARIKEEGVKTARFYSLNKAIRSRIMLFNSILTKDKFIEENSGERIKQAC